MLFFAGIVLVLLGRAVRDRPGLRRGWPLTILGVLVALLIAPAIYSDRVLVNNQGFQVSFAWWSAPLIVDFNNVKSVRVAHEDDLLDGDAGRIHVVLYFDRSYGTAARFELVNDVDVAAARHIMLLAARKRIRTTWMPGTRSYWFKPR